jgi:hypothetical protein
VTARQLIFCLRLTSSQCACSQRAPTAPMRQQGTTWAGPEPLSCRTQARAVERKRTGMGTGSGVPSRPTLECPTIDCGRVSSAASAASP